MSTGLVHLNPEIFPEPLDFRPERWLENEKLNRYLNPFSRGTRQCLGINLAYYEIYLCVASVFSRYGLADNHGPDGYFELFETTREDVELKHDLFIPQGKAGTQGIRVVVK